MPAKTETGPASRINLLTDTVFGVAMTMLAFGLFQRRDAWGAMTPDQILEDIRPQVTALVLSFVVGGLFWVGQHRRLGVTPNRGETSVYGNLAFLLLVLLLPVTTTLYGSKSEASIAIGIYAAHLAVLSGLNLVLWLCALRAEARHGNLLPMTYLAGPAYTTAIFAAVTAIAPHDALVAQRIGLLAFAGPVVDRVARRARWLPAAGIATSFLTHLLLRGVASGCNSTGPGTVTPIAHAGVH